MTLRMTATPSTATWCHSTVKHRRIVSTVSSGEPVRLKTIIGSELQATGSNSNTLTDLTSITTTGTTRCRTTSWINTAAFCPTTRPGESGLSQDARGGSCLCAQDTCDRHRPSRVPLPVFSFTCSPSRVPLHVFSFTCSPSRVPLHVYSFTCSPSRVLLHVFSFTCSTSCVLLHMFHFTCSPSRVLLHAFHFTCSATCVLLHMFTFTCSPSDVLLYVFCFMCSPSRVLLPC